MCYYCAVLFTVPTYGAVLLLCGAVYCTLVYTVRYCIVLDHFSIYDYVTTVEGHCDCYSYILQLDLVFSY